MSREVMIVRWDDLDGAEGTKVPADITAALSFDGTGVELDLTTDHYDELEALLHPYLSAGSPADVSRRGPGRPAGHSGRKYAHKPGIKAYNRAMREWARQRLADHPEYNYVTPGGGIYHPRALKEAYAAHLTASSR